MNGSISIKEFRNNKIILGEGRKLDGKLVLFKNNFQNIIDRINNMRSLSYENKAKYLISSVKVYTS